MLNVVLAGGGTAGHTSPLIATAAALPDARITCVGTPKGLETRVIPAAGLELKLIDPVPLPRSLNLDLVRLPWRLTKAIRQARRVLREAKADVLCGFGGYASIPAYLAAATMRIPVVVHEANALPGISNKIGAKFAAFVATTFPGTPLPKAQVIGMPVSDKITKPTVGRPEAREFFGLAQDVPTLLVSGGSQGARTLNNAIVGARDELLEAGVQILHVLGPKNFANDEVFRGANGLGYHPIEFVEDMAVAYAAADFMVARAGAATVVETSISGLPCLFVPFPHGNGEQERNAADLVQAGGGVLVKDADLDAAKLTSEVLPRITSPETLAKMRAACLDRTPANAAEVLAEAIINVAKKDDHAA